MRPCVRGAAGRFDHFGRSDDLRGHLTTFLGCHVDLVEETAARLRPRHFFEREGVRGFQPTVHALPGHSGRYPAVQSHLQGIEGVAFEADSRTRDAVERCLERLSKAAIKLGPRPMIWRPACSGRLSGNAPRHVFDQVDPT